LLGKARDEFNKVCPTGALFLLAFASLVAAVLLVLLQLTRLGYLVRSTIPDRPRRRMFLASVSFLLTFVGVRILVHRIVNHEGRLQWVVIMEHTSTIWSGEF